MQQPTKFEIAQAKQKAALEQAAAAQQIARQVVAGEERVREEKVRGKVQEMRTKLVAKSIPIFDKVAEDAELVSPQKWVQYINPIRQLVGEKGIGQMGVTGIVRCNVPQYSVGGQYLGYDEAYYLVGETHVTTTAPGGNLLEPVSDQTILAFIENPGDRALLARRLSRNPRRAAYDKIKQQTFNLIELPYADMSVGARTTTVTSLTKGEPFSRTAFDIDVKLEETRKELLEQRLNFCISEIKRMDVFGKLLEAAQHNHEEIPGNPHVSHISKCAQELRAELQTILLPKANQDDKDISLYEADPNLRRSLDLLSKAPKSNAPMPKDDITRFVLAETVGTSTKYKSMRFASTAEIMAIQQIVIPDSEGWRDAPLLMQIDQLRKQHYDNSWNLLNRAGLHKRRDELNGFEVEIIFEKVKGKNDYLVESVFENDRRGVLVERQDYKVEGIILRRFNHNNALISEDFYNKSALMDLCTVPLEQLALTLKMEDPYGRGFDPYGEGLREEDPAEEKSVEADREREEVAATPQEVELSTKSPAPYDGGLVAENAANEVKNKSKDDDPVGKAAGLGVGNLSKGKEVEENSVVAGDKGGVESAKQAVALGKVGFGFASASAPIPAPAPQTKLSPAEELAEKAQLAEANANLLEEEAGRLEAEAAKARLNAMRARAEAGLARERAEAAKAQPKDAAVGLSR